MKKNWLSYMVAAALLSGGLAACNESEFLDLKDPNHFTNDNFWRDKADAESALAAAYSPIKYQMNGFYGAFDGWLNLNSRGDDIFTILNEEQGMWEIATFQNSTTTGNDPYGALYTGIQRANIVLKYIDQVPAGGITDADRSVIKGEALCLRAYQYYLLVTNYGAVPLRLIPSNEDEANKPAASEEEIWKQIEKDFNDAIDCNLPETRASAEKGRIERGTVIAMLAKAYLTQHKYAEAQSLLKGLIDSSYGAGKRYQLMQDYAANFTTANENNAESVFELQYSSDGDYSWGNESGINLGSSLPQFIGPAKSGGWAKLMPSAFVVSEFTKETRGNSSSDADSKYDKRMYASLFFTPSEYGDWVSEDNGWYSSVYYGGRYTMDELWTGNTAKMAGGAPVFTVGGVNGKFLLKKYTAYFIDAGNADSMGSKEGRANNVRVMRFAEVLLMYAEACAKTGDVGQANWALTEIRNRAGLPQKTFGLGDLIDEIEHQCLLEFFGEGHRFDDLKRWYTTAQIQMIFKENDKQGAENFKEKYKYYPIPSGELNNNTAMDQSDLWK